MEISFVDWGKTSFNYKDFLEEVFVLFFVLFVRFNVE